ncbi:hypothetical protein JTB14_028074 [Gonioctena quinquepunctata]|nr:hypothetical protein JTB14_028074 [Gonioctena quinquepunctata]
MKTVLLFSCTLVASSLADVIVNTRRFPEYFKLGVANAAPQIEGAWDADGKSESVWDFFARTQPEKIGDRSTPAIACDSYNKYKEDVAMIKEMGLDMYRLSISWPRILPTGRKESLNNAGVQYYKNLLRELKDNGIEPLVTLYHWDLPQTFQDEFGGWLNEAVVDLFVDYARICFELFGDDVKWWVTINEPRQVCSAGYGSGIFAPGIVSNGIGEYTCNKHVLLAHAKAYRLYDAEFRGKQGEYFKLGVANAAPQIEGAWDADGKSESVWDFFARTQPEKIGDRSTPAIACDSYNKYKEDVAMIKEMGLDMYRLSISWPRILPTGRKESLNNAGVQYYKNLLRELKDNGIEPLVTLYHWDLPQTFQDEFGGWLNEAVVDLFVDYARICFELFGDDVKWWVTINEPRQVCSAGYGSGIFAPGIVSNGIGEYTCNKHVLLAHAKAYRLYDAEFRGKQGGKVAMVIDSPWYEPGSDSAADLEAADRLRQFIHGMYAHPIHIGDWPQVVKDRVAFRSKLEGLAESRLPVFTQEEIDLIRGTHDYIALNHYASEMVSATNEWDIGIPSMGGDLSVSTWARPEWEKGAAPWFNVVPWGFRKLLNWLKNTYGDDEIVITENGLSDITGVLEDDHRVRYFRDYLSNALDAIYEDNVHLTTYLAWSIMDDWEWTGGYGSFLGMYRVDFNDPGRPRIKRRSADYFTQIAKNRCLVDANECTN